MHVNGPTRFFLKVLPHERGIRAFFFLLGESVVREGKYVKCFGRSFVAIAEVVMVALRAEQWGERWGGISRRKGGGGEHNAGICSN